jgi:hypothetical protein
MVAEGVTMRRRMPAAVALVIGLSACASDPLGALGQRSAGWIDEAERRTPVVSTTIAVVSLVPTESVPWWNEELGDLEPGSQEEAVRAVDARRRPGDRFGQASPREVARAVPGIRFPAVVPPSVASITSQLHFAPRSSELSGDFVAAFGFWTVEPYSRSRSVGQAAVLTISLDADGAIRGASGDLSCGTFAGAAVLGCSQGTIDDRTVWELAGELGETWVWFEGPLRHELFVRSGIGRAVAERMIASSVPLEQVAFGGIATGSG